MYCTRPHPKTIDFAASRFVVSLVSGLNVGGVHLERGDEVKPGTLEPRFLRLEYQAHRIELFSRAAEDPSLVEACVSRGVSLSEEPSRATPGPSQEPDPRAKIERLQSMSRKQLVEMCEKHALATAGNKDELVERLSAMVA